MKKSTITIAYDEEKLSALRLFLSQKNLDLDKELGDYLELKDGTAPDKPGKKQLPSVAPCVRF